MQVYKSFFIAGFITLTSLVPLQARADDDITGFLTKITGCALEAKKNNSRLYTLVNNARKDIAKLEKRAAANEKASRQIQEISSFQPTNADDTARKQSSLRALCSSAVQHYRATVAGIANTRAAIEKRKTLLKTQLARIPNHAIACTGIFPKGVTDIVDWITKFSGSLDTLASIRQKEDYRCISSIPDYCQSAYDGANPAPGAYGYPTTRDPKKQKSCNSSGVVSQTFVDLFS